MTRARRRRRIAHAHARRRARLGRRRRRPRRVMRARSDSRASRRRVRRGPARLARRIAHAHAAPRADGEVGGGGGLGALETRALGLERVTQRVRSRFRVVLRLRRSGDQWRESVCVQIPGTTSPCHSPNEAIKLLGFSANMIP